MAFEDSVDSDHMEEDVEVDNDEQQQQLPPPAQQQQPLQPPPTPPSQQDDDEVDQDQASSAMQEDGGGGSAEEEEALEGIPSCIREVDGMELKVGDTVFFQRDQGFLEPGVVVELVREAATGRVLAEVQYQDRTWAKYAGYNQRKDVETLLVQEQLVASSRTRRPPRPITRYQPPVKEPQPKGGAVGGKGRGGGGYKTALPLDEEKERRKAEREKRRRRKLRHQRREAARRRREDRGRRRVLGRRFLGWDDEEGGGSLSEGETGELVRLLGLDQEEGEEEGGEGQGVGVDEQAIRAALQRLIEAGGKEALDDEAEALDATSSDGSLSSCSSSSAGEGSSSSGESSAFPEPDSPSESEPAEESDVGLSDVSTDSCPSEPEHLYWPRLATPGPGERKAAGLARFALCPKADSDDSGESDEEEQEMGLTATVAGWTAEERKALLQEYLARPASVARRARTGALSYKEWCLALHIISEDFGGVGHLESCQAVKGVVKCEGIRTMYGAIRAPLIQEMIRVARITLQDRFIDIGSGLGTVVLQVAAVAGCSKATGIELETSRYSLSAMLHEELTKCMENLGAGPEFVQGLQERIEMVQGDIRHYEDKILSATVIYFNNHGVWFDETLSKQGELSVEHWVARLFAKCAVGTRMVILKSMPHLKGNWFKEEVYYARADWLTWARDGKPLFFYTKLKDTWTCEKCAHENPIVADDEALIWEMACANNCASRAHRLRARGRE